MKRSIVLVSLGFLILTASVWADGATKYGEGVNLKEATPVAEILAHPSQFMGRVVRIDGVITGVCKKRGCWIQVTNKDGKGLRVKVEDGVIVFPATSMGQTASAEGVFTGIPKAAMEAKHEEHKGEKHEACDAEPSGEMVYFIKGTGAVIQS